MSSRPGHLSTSPPSPEPGWYVTSTFTTVTVTSHPPRLWRKMAHRLVHLVLRVSPYARREEWGEPWAVANQCDSAPVGEPVEDDPLLAVLSSSRVPDIERRD